MGTGNILSSEVWNGKWLNLASYELYFLSLSGSIGLFICFRLPASASPPVKH